jgi:serine/threonine protein kinase
MERNQSPHYEVHARFFTPATYEKPMQRCPTDDQLNEYVSGRLSKTAHDDVDSHLDACARCHSLVETLDGEVGTIFDVLKEKPAPESTSNAELRHLVQLAKSVRDPNVADTVRPGDVLGNYELGERIGVGGMGQVFKAYHRRMKRDVAIKVVAPELLRSANARERFQREVEAAAKLTHPNVVAAYDADEADGHCFLALEFVDGKNLAEIIEAKGALPMGDAVHYVLQAARGLKYAHDQGIVHRDIKPANLMLVQQPPDSGDRHSIVKILDMGLARVVVESNAGQESDLTNSQAMMGTASFMAPEQAQNPRDADHRADIYALGCTLYFLLTGKHVFDGKTVMEVVFAHREQSAPRLKDSVSECPPRLEKLFQRIVAKEPAARPQSLEEVISELEAVLSDRPVQPVAKRALSPTRRIAVVVSSIAVVAVIVIALVVWNGNHSGGPKDSAAVTPHEGSPPPGTPVIEMVEISAGSFLMGATDDDLFATQDQKPQHEVRISQPFMMAKLEITRAQFREAMGAAASKQENKGSQPDAGQRPISGINWITAIEFCNRLSERHGLEPYYEFRDDVVRRKYTNGFRLPTEAEWEYACRANSKAKWHFGNDPQKLDEYEWHAGNSDGRPQTVGKLKPNAFGLHDMHGNVPEWCWDRFDPDYYRRSEVVDPQGSTAGKLRVFRGGSASNRVTQTAASERAPLGGTYGAGIEEIDLLLGDDSDLPGSKGVGIRVVRSIK